MNVQTSGFERVEAKLAGFFNGFDDDLRAAGQGMAEKIVETTLQGVGADDGPFAPYSESYQKMLDALGGKPNVNLRGLLAHDADGAAGRRASKADRLKGPRGARRVKVSVNGKTFTARLARGIAGLTDPQSEMSLDLITVEASGGRVTLTYSPRGQAYMLYHQAGAGKLPQRMWFTARKSAVEAALVDRLKAALARRAAAFNG